MSLPRLRPDRLVITVTGRPAPQGSKRLGEHGQMLEQSRYLPAWRSAVVRDTYRAYRDLGIGPEGLPVFAEGPLVVSIEFYLSPAQLTLGRIDGPPDLDKLCRSTWDALTHARMWTDDGQVAEVTETRKVLAAGTFTGAFITARRSIIGVDGGTVR